MASDNYSCKVRGVSFRQEAVETVNEKDRVYIRNEASEHDPSGHALGIYTPDGDLLGFVGGDDRDPIRQITKNKYKASILKKTKWTKDTGEPGPTALKIKVAKT